MKMQTITLYRYTREGGGVTTSPIAPPDGTLYDLCYRLLADDGKAITDGTTVAACIDVSAPDGLTEIDDPGESSDEATADDYRAALAEMGVQV